MKTSTTKILSIAVILLLLVNIAMIIFMLNRGKPHHDGKNSRGKSNDPFEMIAKELNMTDEQRTTHLKFRDEYFTSVRPLLDSVRTAKQAFFALIKEENVSDSIFNIYANRIAERQIAADKLTFEHFRRVRALYNPDQQKKYDEFVQKMIQRSGNKKRDSADKEK